MKITFVLPGSSRIPMGGLKVAFEYANSLAERGHAVTLVHPAHLLVDERWREKLYHDVRYLLWGTTGRFGPEGWFKLLPAVRMLWVRSLRESSIPAGDAIVATGWPTAEHVATYKPDKGRKFYLMQSYETWWGPEERVRATWRLPLHKIVISHWLEDIAREMGESSTYIPNGLNFEVFGCDVPISERRHPQVLMLSHEGQWKGTADGLKALEIARGSVPELTVTLFGVASPPSRLPSWIRYVRNPPQRRLRELYNEATVFLSPSWIEGWPLPPAEAMICGAAVVCTDIGGHREYAVHERNALLVPARSPEALAQALVRMLTEHALRQSLAEQARIDIGRFTWKAATDRFEAVLSAAEQAGGHAGAASR